MAPFLAILFMDAYPWTGQKTQFSLGLFPFSQNRSIIYV